MTDTTPSGNSLSTPNIEEYVRLTLKKRELQKQLREHESNLRRMESRVLDDMLQSGVASIKIPDGTVYIADSVRARLQGDTLRHEAADALRRSDAAFLLQEDFNLNSVSAWCREVLESGAELPPEVTRYFEIVQGPVLRVRKSS